MCALGIALHGILAIFLPSLPPLHPLGVLLLGGSPLDFSWNCFGFPPSEKAPTSPKPAGRPGTQRNTGYACGLTLQVVLEFVWRER